MGLEKIIQRRTPLGNIVLGLIASGEAIGRFFSGDSEAALDSSWAAICNLAAGFAPYLTQKGEINLSSGILNGLIAGSGLYELNFTRAKPTRSITLMATPFVAIYNVGSNGVEAYIRKGKE